MDIRPVSGCAIGKGMFASFAGMENTDTLPIRLVTECMEKFSRNCNYKTCPRFRIGFVGSIRISWINKGPRI